MLRIISRATVLTVALVLLAAASASAHVAPWKPTWLCKPGLAANPCSPGLSTMEFSPTYTPLGVLDPLPARAPAIDCFYVYPTVSEQKTGNSNLHIDPEERLIALYQAARYSQYCRVYAPMYRQVTLYGIHILGVTPTTRPNDGLALRDVEAAFAYYLKHSSHGRGFVLIGHSQGAFILRELIAREIDSNPALRSRLVSAILLGGDVLVRPGRAGVGGDFRHIPACRSARQLHCVIAFSSFNQPVPKTSIFGRAPKHSKDIVLCTNPAALGGGSAVADAIFPTATFAPQTLISIAISLLHLTPPQAPTTWFELPSAYRIGCRTSNGAHVLWVTALNGAQVPSPSPDPTWGLHLLDGNIALGDLISIVRAESQAYAG
ncbi:MAG TPA: DUF3089 domain-containing protein [Solirubrobacteraceae bacterium]|nr:DUF3089 domain-containing protein [Solirubrobacteraceae bacterium]